MYVIQGLYLQCNNTTIHHSVMTIWHCDIVTLRRCDTLTMWLMYVFLQHLNVPQFITVSLKLSHYKNITLWHYDTMILRYCDSVKYVCDLGYVSALSKHTAIYHSVMPTMTLWYCDVMTLWHMYMIWRMFMQCLNTLQFITGSHTLLNYGILTPRHCDTMTLWHMYVTWGIFLQCLNT